MQVINGTYYCKMDAKGRIMLPSELRKQFANLQMDSFILKRGTFHKNLEMYPLSVWEIILRNLNKLNKFQKKNVDFISFFLAGSRNVNIDSTGRMQVPRDLVNIAGLKKEVVIASVVNTLQVWDKDAYEAFLQEMTQEDFADLTEEVGSQINIDFEDE